MKIAIGAGTGTVGGPATYAVELVRALVTMFHEHEFVVLTDKPAPFATLCATRELPMTSPWQQPLWDHVRVPRALAAGRFDLYHATKGVVPRLGKTPAVVTIHDLASHVMPQTFRAAQRIHLGLETPWALAHARVVLAPSQSTADDIARLFPSLATPVVVTPEAAASGLHPPTPDQIAAWRGRRGIDQLACGYLGTIQPRKNVALFVDAFLRAARDRDWRLLLAGRLRPGEEVPSGGGDRRIVHLGAMPADEIAPFLGSLRCMVSPSSYEGFGLTFIEAMACGCPVVGLRNSSIPEVVGSAGVLLARPDVEALAAVIERLMTDDAMVTDLSRRGREQAAKFSWSETARRTMHAYRLALGEAGAAPS
jgi:glycosyltransferase involved in cell wall biosynthesis